MIQITDQLLAAIKAHAQECQPRESCGVVVLDGDLRYIPCNNVAVGMDDFKIQPSQYADIEDRFTIVAIVHSHPNSHCQPSMADRVACENSGLPWIIIGLPLGEVSQIEPCGYEAPYLERPFVMGVLDCYALARDWYRRERQLILPNIEREMNFWRDPAKNYFVNNFAAHGFESLPIGTMPEVGDAFLMQIRGVIPNHCAVYIGEGKILQHCLGQLSQRYTYGGTWAALTTHHLRHHA